MANPINRLFGLSGGEARVKYKAGEYQVVQAGDFVTCAVTGQQIPVDNLKYWSVERQEPYASAAASLERELQVRGLKTNG